MRIVSILENQNIEKRIAITPDIAKKYIALGFEISLAEKYGEHLGFKDNDYKLLGVIAILFSIFWFSKIEAILIGEFYSKNIVIKTKTPITATVPHSTNFVKLFQVFLWFSLSIKITFVLL